MELGAAFLCTFQYTGHDMYGNRANVGLCLNDLFASRVKLKEQERKAAYFVTFVLHPNLINYAALNQIEVPYLSSPT